jgi:hypothetical protein
MTEQEELEHLKEGYKKLNNNGKRYLKDLSQQLFYVQYPVVNPSNDKDAKKKKESKKD